MSNFYSVEENKIIQSEDNLTWNNGDNPVIFPEPFSDIAYTFQPTIEDSAATVVEKANSRTPSGLTVTVVGVTTKGAYNAMGNSNEYRMAGIASLGVGTNGFIQTGRKTLNPGENLITLKKVFTDTNWTFSPLGNGTLVTCDLDSRTLQTIKVYNASEDPIDFTYIAIGA